MVVIVTACQHSSATVPSKQKETDKHSWHWFTEMTAVVCLYELKEEMSLISLPAHTFYANEK